MCSYYVLYCKLNKYSEGHKKLLSYFLVQQKLCPASEHQLCTVHQFIYKPSLIFVLDSLK